MLILGHRGARGHAPENTMASFQAALAMGADGIELDVQMTKGRQGRRLPRPLVGTHQQRYRLARRAHPGGTAGAGFWQLVLTSVCRGKNPDIT